MNTHKKIVLALIVVLTLPATAFTMSHGSHGGHDMKKMGEEKAAEMKHHGDMAHGDQGKHAGHDMSDEGFTEIGKSTTAGVTATLKVKSYDEATIATMAKMGVEATHHVMVFFTDEKSGAEFGDGTVAIKVKSGSDESAKPVMLMYMGKGFGSDIALKGKGMYSLEVGTKLKDGEKRQFSFDYHNH